MDTLSLSPLNFAFQLFLELECRDVIIYLSEIYSTLFHIGKKEKKKNHREIALTSVELFQIFPK